MIVLVINNGSTSSRFSIIDPEKNILLASGGAENIGTSSSYYKYENYRGDKEKVKVNIKNYDEALTIMMTYILSNNLGVINSIKDIDVIGHRVVHGGEKYTKATFIDDEVLKDIQDLSLLAPLHNMKAVETISNCQAKFSGIDNIAVFDTAFHSTIPKENYLYAIPKELYEKYKIRKYGFHGTSYSYVLNRYIDITKKEKDTTNVVMCHLGGGCSMCAVKNGKSFDTTMEYTPLSGLIMASRSGSVDPLIIPYIMKIYNVTADEVIDILNNKSGYLAMCGEKDAKAIVDRSLSGDKDALFLRSMSNYNFKKYLMSMLANLESVDSIIMTGGMSAKNKEQRELFLSNLSQFGILLDRDKNNDVFDTEAIISSEKSNIPIYVIPTDEEKEIANQCKKLIMKRN